MEALTLIGLFVVLLYLITRKWFWMTLLVLCAIGLLFTPLASLVALGIMLAAGFIILHLVFIALMFVLSTLFIFS